MFSNLKPEKTIKAFGQGNSQIDLVCDQTTDKRYILKRIRNIDTPLQEAMFYKETNALKKLHYCKNIVSLIHAAKGICGGISEGRMYLEYISGDTLQHEAYRFHTVCQKLSIAKQIIDTVSTIHNSGIIHRDINPSNIMMTDDQITIIDFGICKILGETSKETTNRMATNRYAAPEVAYHCGNASAKSDMYSVGATILFLFTKQEPPLPQEINRTISLVSGIDPLLKDVLIKMTEANPDERYEDMATVDIAMHGLYERYLKNEDVYRVQLAYDMLERLRSRNLLPRSIQRDEALRETIPLNFSDCYATTKKSDGDPKEDYYIFEGRHYDLTCVYSDKDECFIAIDVSPVRDNIRMMHKQSYMETNGSFHFSPYTTFYITRNNSFELKNRLIDFSHDTLSAKNIDREYESRYGFWQEYIDTMILAKKLSAARYEYTGIQFNGSKIKLQLAENAMFDNDTLSVGDNIIYEKPRRGKGLETLSIGTFISYNASERSLLLDAPKKRSRLRVPNSGEAIKDYYPEIAQYLKQKQALFDFARQETLSTGNMKAIFSGLAEPDLFNYEIDKYKDKKLDDVQRLAVQKAMQAQDIFVIQGPPGTGKTNVIVEIVRQMLKQHNNVDIQYGKILIVAQAHAAVDKLLEDLDEYVKKVRTIRVGDIKNLTQLVREKYSIATLKQQWIGEVAEKASCKRDQVLKENKIVANEFLEYYTAFETKRLLTASAEEHELAQLIMDTFCAKYSLATDDAILEKLETLQNWINQVSEKDDLIEYYIKNSTIIVGTCAGFMGNDLFLHLQNIAFDCVIVDEAAKATMPELMLSLIRSRKVILVGDHQQLPPVFDENALEQSCNKHFDIEMLKHGGFKRLYETLPDKSRQRLTTQYRMHPIIGSMISKIFYDNDIQNGVAAKDRQIDIGFLNNSTIAWISTSSSASESKRESKDISSTSYSNPHEVSIVMQLLRKLDAELHQGKYSIGIITAYRGQLELLRRDYEAITLNNIDIDINTVDAFQGSQRDIIIYSTVRSTPGSKIGFLKEESRLNVAFSRARSLLIIVGDLDCLYNAKDAKFKDIVDYMRCNSDNCVIMDYNKEAFKC